MEYNFKNKKCFVKVTTQHNIDKINNHPLYNSVGRVNEDWLGFWDYQNRIYCRPNEYYSVISQSIKDGYIDCNAQTKNEDEAVELFFELVEYKPIVSKIKI